MDALIKWLFIANIGVGCIVFVAAIVTAPGLGSAPVGVVAFIAISLVLPILMVGERESAKNLRDIAAVVILAGGLLIMLTITVTGQLTIPVSLLWMVVAIIGIWAVWSALVWLTTRRPSSAQFTAGTICGLILLIVSARPRLLAELMPYSSVLVLIISGVGIWLLFASFNSQDSPVGLDIEDLMKMATENEAGESDE